MIDDKRKKLPNNTIVRKLREIWFERNGKRRNSELADILEINASALSAYCSEKEMNPPRRCPEWVILRMLEMLDIDLLVSGEQITLREGSDKVKDFV